jgi:hypothetical protein
MNMPAKTHHTISTNTTTATTANSTMFNAFDGHPGRSLAEVTTSITILRNADETILTMEELQKLSTTKAQLLDSLRRTSRTIMVDIKRIDDAASRSLKLKWERLVRKPHCLDHMEEDNAEWILGIMALDGLRDAITAMAIRKKFFGGGTGTGTGLCEAAALVQGQNGLQVGLRSAVKGEDKIRSGLKKKIAEMGVDVESFEASRLFQGQDGMAEEQDSVVAGDNGLNSGEDVAESEEDVVIGGGEWDGVIV